MTHDLLCNAVHVYFSDLIFDLSVIREHRWSDLRKGRSTRIERVVRVANGMLIICSGITVCSELFNYSISATNILIFMLFIYVTFVWPEETKHQ